MNNEYHPEHILYRGGFIEKIFSIILIRNNDVLSLYCKLC